MGQWDCPGLSGVVEAPILRPDGSILRTPGYDPTTKLIYRPFPGLEIPSIPDAPTESDVAEACAVIEDVLVDFPIVDQASRANAWAALITSLTRSAISGRIPLALILSPAPGSGKGLLVDTFVISATGHTSVKSAIPKDEDEWRKSLTSLLKKGSTHIVFDNAVTRLDSAQLCRALTSEIYGDRLLGTNQTGEYPQQAVWFGWRLPKEALILPLPGRLMLMFLPQNSQARCWRKRGDT